MPREHRCVGGRPSAEPSWWLKDCHGIELCRLCPACKEEKKRGYRPEVFSGYSQDEIDERIEEEC